MEGAKIDAELVCLEEVVEGDIDAKKSKKWLQPSTWTWQGEYNGLSPKAGTAASTKVSFLLLPFLLFLSGYHIFPTLVFFTDWV